MQYSLSKILRLNFLHVLASSAIASWVLMSPIIVMSLIAEKPRTELSLLLGALVMPYMFAGFGIVIYWILSSFLISSKNLSVKNLFLSGAFCSFLNTVALRIFFDRPNSNNDEMAWVIGAFIFMGAFLTVSLHWWLLHKGFLKSQQISTGELKNA